jgi:hypothetical protein
MSIKPIVFMLAAAVLPVAPTTIQPPPCEYLPELAFVAIDMRQKGFNVNYARSRLVEVAEKLGKPVTPATDRMIAMAWSFEKVDLTDIERYLATISFTKRCF